MVPTAGAMPLFQIPVVTVPTVVNDEVTTVLFKMVLVNVPASAVTVELVPNAMAVPLTVKVEFDKLEFGIADVINEPELTDKPVP